jgi:hypothetical protein
MVIGTPLAQQDANIWAFALLRAGADPTIKNKRGVSPLDLVSSVARSLLTHKYEPFGDNREEESQALKQYLLKQTPAADSTNWQTYLMLPISWRL